MANPYLGEIRTCSFGFPPKGWAMCNGQLLPIAQNQALFSLLGTQYGGNGQTNFALPDLRGRSPLHAGNEVLQGEAPGTETVTLIAAELPVHQHGLVGNADPANANVPGLAAPAAKPRGGVNRYAPAGSDDVMMHADSLARAGGSQPHPNMQPFLGLNFVIALVGIFPSRN